MVYAAVDGKYIGRVTLSDLLRDDAYNIGEKLKAIGINKTVILSGDKQSACNEIAALTAADKAVGELLPDGKVIELEKLMKENGDVIFMGDGINDAPSLSLASVGAAMGGVGSAAASQAADVILMTDKPSLIVKAIKIARKTLRIARENIFFALAVKFIVLILGVLGIANMWLAVFADVGVCFIAILNSLRMLKMKD